MRLHGKTALITGSSRGIGRAIAKRFAHEGADVMINYSSSATGAREALAEVEAAGRKGHMIQADLSVVSEARGLIGETIQRFGKLDVLVNNAGIEINVPFWKVTEEEYDRVLNVNLRGAFFVTQTMVQHLMDTKRPGKIINISSVHEELPFPNFAPYCASKGGLRMLTRDLAIELGRFGITINGIAPGAIETAMNTKLLNDPVTLPALLRQIPLGRLGRPDDVAGVAAFLASADADYVTGSTYFVDGGLTWHYEEQSAE